MTANFADGMFILVLGMGDLAEAACGLVAAGAALAASLAAALAGLGDGAGSRSSTVVMWLSPFGIGILILG